MLAPLLKHQVSNLVSNERLSSLAMLVLLVISLFVYSIGSGIYLGLGLEPSATLEFLYTVVFLCSLVWWLKAEARRYKIGLVYCPGLLVGFGWAIIIPYHLLKTRGVRGFIPLGALIGSYLVAQVLAILAYLFFSTYLRTE